MTFNTILSKEGVILVSLLSTDYPFVVMKNKAMVFLPIHAGYANYDLRQDPRCAELDLSRMILYNAYNVMTDGRTHWVLAIPFNGFELIASNYLSGLSLGSHKVFSKDDFPEDFEQYNHLAVVCGFPE